jgi:hypothetical protein
MSFIYNWFYNPNKPGPIISLLNSPCFAMLFNKHCCCSCWYQFLQLRGHILQDQHIRHHFHHRYQDISVMQWFTYSCIRGNMAHPHSVQHCAGFGLSNPQVRHHFCSQYNHNCFSALTPRKPRKAKKCAKGTNFINAMKQLLLLKSVSNTGKNTMLVCKCRRSLLQGRLISHP